MMPWRSKWLAFLILGTLGTLAWADGPGDNVPGAVRRLPKSGVEIPPEDQRVLEQGLEKLEASIQQLERKNDRWVTDLLPDVKIYHKAVRDAVKYDEIFTIKEVGKAKSLLKQGQERADQLGEGVAPWINAEGLVVRGYVSKIDGSVQPYGLVVPESLPLAGLSRVRLDVWFHGRNETLSELNFLDERTHQAGQFTPRDTIVLHPYGRYCNAFKFAGEVDVLEAIDSVKARYRVDEDRISVRGFSMGGAACWQFAVHYPDRWFAANPGAGFSETPRFLRVFQNETLTPSWYEQTLWKLYDCPDYAVNLAHCPTVAYSGENDRQKQAADVMADALKREGIDLVHVIGPNTQHAYHPDAKREVERLMDSLATRGRIRNPDVIDFETYTLKYNRMHWVVLDRLGEHWKRARVHAERIGQTVEVQAENIQGLTLEFQAGFAPFSMRKPVKVVVDGRELDGPSPRSDLSWVCKLERSQGRWKIADSPTSDPGSPTKRHDLQGPIDDAFMDAFLFVTPSGEPAHAKVGEWARAESERAIEHWRRHFRGEPQVKVDRDVTEDDLARYHLVLWGDASSNQVLARVADRLPISWNATRIQANDRSFEAEKHALISITPNPLNPKKYVVLNSGFTFREYDYLNNARQVPKLPDWAIINLESAPNARTPGRVVAADFYDEAWKLKPFTPGR